MQSAKHTHSDLRDQPIIPLRLDFSTNFRFGPVRGYRKMAPFAFWRGTEDYPGQYSLGRDEIVAGLANAGGAAPVARLHKDY
ncbi:hypothetical protein [Bradyrhizobium stylosanthis]|uniref:Uncharacterized protein n=1 Tax=Bradyrhizobium stylosanthis TaxID=1803665 RepID=A0A560E2E0_9BRAD|nr:hypothetical protein [Bradyrhizobium stylosanthis]TWB03546.1 hypothetical protein FBZ96_10217 [Bradyrhizobium stylosanthis]